MFWRMIYNNREVINLADKQRFPVKKYIDADTGEITYADQIVREYMGQKPFWKMYKEDFLNVFRLFDGKQKDILIYILDNIKQYDNSFSGTYKTISKDLHVSEVTIAKTMRGLQEIGFITISSLGVWRINPNYLMRGNETKRIILEKEFCNLSDNRAIINTGHINEEKKEGSA